MGYQPPDGHKRSLESERQLNEACASAFASEAGKLVLAYLRQITIESVGGPGIQRDHLMHLEGQRFIVGVIEQRVRHWHNDQPRREDHARNSRAQHRQE